MGYKSKRHILQVLLKHNRICNPVIILKMLAIQEVELEQTLLIKSTC